MNLNRIQWIDLMKSIGMLMVIWGHCFPDGFIAFIYLFNVPVFYLISGFLSKHAKSLKEFWSKLWITLIVPYLILCGIKDLGDIIEHFGENGYVYTIFAILTGFHSLGDYSGCGNLWFVYTLAIIKIIHQYCIHTKRDYFIALLISIIGWVVYNKCFEHVSFAYTCVFGAMPYYLLGSYAKKYHHEMISAFVQKVSNMQTAKFAFAFMLLILSAVGISTLTGEIMMYKSEYGQNVFLALLGGIIGSLCVFILSVYLNRCKIRLSYYISIGTIVILCFHRDINHPLLKIIDKLDLGIVANGMATLLSSFIVLLCFIPIIYVIKKYVPIILGNRK